MISDGLKALIDDLVRQRREYLSSRLDMRVDGEDLVLTDEQAFREYGTPETAPEPWLWRALRDG